MIRALVKQVLLENRINLYLIYFGLILFILSVIALFINYSVTSYPGNNYIPPQITVTTSILFLMYLGFHILLGKNAYLPIIIKEFIFFFFISLLITFSVNAIQYTPFKPIDQSILAIESFLHIHTSTLIPWVFSQTSLKNCLELIYASLSYQMVLIPMLVIASKQLGVMREYYFLLLISTLIGFTFYYFFPTTAPASIINSPFFNEEQRATGLKFAQIHHYIKPNTIDGGMISLPSFHVIWAWYSLYILRNWTFMFLLLLPINFLLMASCVLLGWHYVLDVLASFLIIIFSHSFYWTLDKRHEKRLMSLSK